MLLSNGNILACNRNASKIGVLDNIGIFITIGEGIINKDGKNFKDKRVCKLPNVTNGEL